MKMVPFFLGRRRSLANLQVGGIGPNGGVWNALGGKDSARLGRPSH